MQAGKGLFVACPATEGQRTKQAAREVVEPPSLGTFKTHLEIFLCNVL